MTTTILVIDDSEDDQRLYRRAFKDFESSFNLVMTSSAEAGLARIADAKPDLILLDYNLPDMDGLSFMKRLAASSDNAIPIVMLTGENSVAVAVEAMKRGADDYLVKDTEGVYLRLLPGVVGRVMDSYVQRELNLRLQKETETLLRRNQILMQNSMDGIHVLDIQGNVVDTNNAFCHMLGYTREEVARLNVADWDAQWSAEELLERSKQLIGKSTRFETVHRRKDGSLIDVEIALSSAEIEGRYLTFASSHDITERKKAETSLMTGEANMKALLDNLPYLTWLKDAEGRYITINKMFADYLRLDDVCQAIGKTDLDLQPKELAEKYRADDAEVMATGQKKHVEESAFDGSNTRWVETFKTPIIDGYSNVLGTVGIARDITERKNAEEKLRLENETGRKRANELAQQFGYLLQNSFNEIYLFDAISMRFILTSEGAEKNLDYSDEELNQLTPLDLKPSYTRGSFEELIAPLRRGEQQTLLFETFHRRKDGTTYPVEVRLQLMEVEPPVFLAIVQDITERKAAEEGLRLRSNILNCMAEGVYLIRASDGEIVFANPQFERMFGYESGELLGKHVSTINAPGENNPETVADAIMSELARAGAWSGEVCNIKKDGTHFWCRATVSAFEHSQFGKLWVSVHEDITERKEAEQNKRKLARALKLLSECGTLMIHAKNEQLLLEETCLLAVVTGGFLMAWVGIAENDADKTVRPIALSGYEDGYLGSIKVVWSDTELGQGPTGTAIRTRATVVCQNCMTNPKMAPWREAAITRGYQSSIALPLSINNHVLGALTIYSSDPLAFNDEDVELLEELANNVAFGIEKLRTREAQERAEQESFELSKHLQIVREEEKASFAREIHDELGGTLAALKMDAYWLARKLETGKEMEPLRACAQSMIGLLNNAVLATRRIITDLRPTLLDDLGLMEALKWQSADFQKRTGIECWLACDGDNNCEGKLDGLLPINLFRIFQEALTNASRHSGASIVNVCLRHDDKEVVLSVSDNGRGLPEGHTIPLTSYGLRGMRERVVQLGGKIKFDTPPDGGFSVTVALPMSAENRN
jgi:PAS domain S-box-containing protein